MEVDQSPHEATKAEVTLWTLTRANISKTHDGFDLQVSLRVETCVTFPEGLLGCMSGTISYPHSELARQEKCHPFSLSRESECRFKAA